MRAGFYTLGCKVNQYETQIMKELLISGGYDIVDEDALPDVFIVNSCTVTGESDRKTRQMVRRYRTKFPHSVIVLTGCMPQAFPDDAIKLDAADIVLGNASNNELIQALNEFHKTGKRVVKIETHKKENVTQKVSVFHERTKAFLKIEDGCDRFCSYCIIPTARGRVRSKTLEDIKNEVQTLAKAGYQEVVLIGINLSAYGKDLNVNLADAVETACSVDGIKRIRLGSIEPDQLNEEILQRLSLQNKLCPQFHLSLQSGCDRTLKSMNRHYDTAFYYNLVSKIRNTFTNAAITTDIMVGFPGETEDDFAESQEFARRVKFAKAHIFAYSKREGTKAAEIAEQVPNQIKESRSKQMIAVTVESQNEFLNSQIGSVYPVLFENRSKDGYYEGYTANYTLVKVKAEENPCGKLLNVIITKCDYDSCIGNIQ